MCKGNLYNLNETSLQGEVTLSKDSPSKTTGENCCPDRGLAKCVACELGLTLKDFCARKGMIFSIQPLQQVCGIFDGVNPTSTCTQVTSISLVATLMISRYGDDIQVQVKSLPSETSEIR